MQVSGTYKEAVKVETPKATIRIHAPERTPDEQEKQNKIIHNATVKFIKSTRELKKWQNKKSITG